ncbi:ADP-ribosylglycohydrolase family protein [Mycoplasmatota bacterium WC44]
MKAYEITKKLLYETKPVLRKVEDQTWDAMTQVEEYEDIKTSMLWRSNVPGSGAPESIMAAMVQALENRGYEIPGAIDLVIKGLEYHDNKNFIELHKITSLLFEKLNNANIVENHSYWKYNIYESFEDYEKVIDWPDPIKVDVSTKKFLDQTKAGWVSQMIGAAAGTQVEGYVTDNLYEVFGDVTEFLREPTTYNDDLTFELSFLNAFNKKGYEVSSRDIALEWIGLVPAGWSAEDIALRNIKYGIMPPESGRLNNPFNEWIGAQMRGAVCGMVAPGDVKMAATLAWQDGEVSHANNGIFGEVFNAILVSLAYVNDDVRQILIKGINLIPNDSEYYSVLEFAYNQCLNYENWIDAWKVCEKEYVKYNWIHAYPNAAAEIVALYYGNGDFNKTINIITMAGMDVDCNAAQIMTVIGVILGYDNIPKKWLHPAFENIVTYMRDFREISLDEIVEMTIDSIK